MFFDIFLIKICIPIKLDSFAFELSIQYSSPNCWILFSPQLEICISFYPCGNQAFSLYTHFIMTL